MFIMSIMFDKYDLPRHMFGFFRLSFFMEDQCKSVQIAIIMISLYTRNHQKKCHLYKSHACMAYNTFLGDWEYNLV